MTNEVTIVTAFFDIGRGEYAGKYNRSAEKYIDYFRFWAKIKNRLIVYTYADVADQVRQIRADYGRDDVTEVIVIDDIATFDADALDGIKRVMASPEFIANRNSDRHPECIYPLYNYVTYLKPFFVVDTYERGLVTSKTVAWMDFGFNHGGDFYANSDDFDFLWQYDFGDKMHLFGLKEADSVSIIDIVKTRAVYIAGTLMIGNQARWEEFKTSFSIALRWLLKHNLADDDQTLELMAYRADPEKFEIHSISRYLHCLYKVGGEHLEIAKEWRPKYKTARARYREAIREAKYAKAVYFALLYIFHKLSRQKELVPIV